MRKGARDAGGGDNAERAQQYRGRGDGLGAVDVGVKAAVEHDKNQGHRTDILGQSIVLKRDLHDAVAAEEHPQQDKGQQRRHPQLAGKPVAQHAGQNDNGG